MVNEYNIENDLNNVLDETLSRLYTDDVDLIRGDLVNFKTSDKCLFLFDGDKIINIYHGTMVTFPEDFDLINQNIPFGYWNRNLINFEYSQGIYFDKLTFAFDNRKVKGQAIKNCQILAANFSVAYTWVMINNIKYIVIYEGLEKFIDILKNDQIFLYVDTRWNDRSIQKLFETSINNIYLCK